MSTSPSTVQARRLMFPAKQQVKIESFDPGEPQNGQVRVKTSLSLMSTGTENIVYNRIFDPGTHWDEWAKYPFYPGYASVGTVEALGPKATTLKIGDRVAYRLSHRSHGLIDAPSCSPIPEGSPFEYSYSFYLMLQRCFVIPKGVTFEQAAWFSMAKIAFMGALAAQHYVGDTVLVIGAGPIGQMAIRWARVAGAASIIAVDTAANRMPLAQAGGATALITAPIGEAREAILQAGQGKLPRVIIDTTGNAAVFSIALGLAADQGRVVILGDTGQPTKQSLTLDVIRRGLSIIGAHDSHNTPQWHDTTIIALFFDLVLKGQFSLEGLNSHIFDPANCEDAYNVVNRERAATMGVVFDWKA